jgi:hypothetical protein
VNLQTPENSAMILKNVLFPELELYSKCPLELEAQMVRCHQQKNNTTFLKHLFHLASGRDKIWKLNLK